MIAPWQDESGVVSLPSGLRVRGRSVFQPAGPADFALVLASGPRPPWPHRVVRWPDFGLPLDTRDALDALHDAFRRSRTGERVEVACRGGIGRTGTALAGLAILDGLDRRGAIAWVRATYHPRSVETPWQGRWLRHLESSG